MKKAGNILSRCVETFMGRVFRARNVIVVSAGEVKHYPVSSRLQLVLIFGVMGFLSWASYSTGSYFAAQSILAEKERKIETTTIANRRMEEQFSLLKHDLLKLQDKAEVLNEYDRFVLEQHALLSDARLTGNTQIDDNGLKHINQNLLQERIDYLESIVDQMQGERDLLVSSLNLRTKERIDLYKDIIQSTGLNISKLIKEARTNRSEELAKLESVTTNEDGETFDNQGGPYIPLNATEGMGEPENLLFENVEEMMALDIIIGSLPLASPMENARSTSGYGRRKDPFTRGWAMHRGLDFVGNWNSEVKATAPATVLRAGRSGAYGYMVELDHGFGLTTRYAHLKKTLVSKGDRVETGQAIGLQGSTGRSTGSHLHYEVRYHNKALNPAPFIKAEAHVFKEK